MKKGKCFLLWLLFGMVPTTASFHANAKQAPGVVAISAKRFEFSPTQISLKKGEPVTLRLTTDDVKHGFFSKALQLDAELIPGKTTEVTITPQTAGTFTTICDSFCGSGHGNMKMTIVVEKE